MDNAAIQQIGPLPESHQHDIGDILRESLRHEAAEMAHHAEVDTLLREQTGRPENFAET